MKRFSALVMAWLASTGVAFATVNVNTAQQSELQRVKGLDKIAAKRIIEYRAQNGDYRTLDELGKVIDPAALDRVKPQLALAGDAYVPPPTAEKPEKVGKKKKAK
jgi:competence protein ComEA